MSFSTELKDKWIEALSSDKFKQGKSGLFNSSTNSHCCLGVLCEVLKIQNIPTDTHFNRYLFPSVSGNHPQEHDSVYIPTDFASSIGLKIDDMCYLAALNDRSNDYKATIDYIEKNI